MLVDDAAVERVDRHVGKLRVVGILHHDHTAGGVNGLQAGDAVV